MLLEVTRVPRPNVAQAVDMPEGATIADVLKRLTIPPDAVLVVRGDDPVPLDAPAQAGDRLRVVTVYSGG